MYHSIEETDMQTSSSDPCAHSPMSSLEKLWIDISELLESGTSNQFPLTSSFLLLFPHKV